jgi:hypothetical protein
MARHRGAGGLHRPVDRAAPRRLRAAERRGGRGVGRGGGGHRRRGPRRAGVPVGNPRADGCDPVQNVGAYGVEVADLLVDVDLYDRRADAVRTRVPAAELGLGYRTSVLKGRDDAVVLRVRFALPGDAASAPIRYPELARAWASSRAGGCRPPRPARPCWACAAARAWCSTPTTRHLERRVLLHHPVLAESRRARGRPALPAGPGLVKVPAAWLIERAGFRRGHPGPGAARPCRASTCSPSPPGRRHGGRPPGAGAGGARRRPGRVRHHAGRGAGPGRLHPVTA